MSVPPAPAIGVLVDTARYPLTSPGGAAWQQVIAGIRAELSTVGCSVLTDFIRPEHIEALRAQGAAAAPEAYYDVEETNVYNIALDRELPADHPGRIVLQRGNAFVPRDKLREDFIISRLYTDEVFQRFVAECFQLPRVFPLADPLSGLCLNIVKPGMEHPWHFDTNEFTVSMLTQEPEAGGVFEYCPNIRSASSENFGDVRAVLSGSGERLVRQLTLRPGDLQLFKGRYSLHRVSPVTGGRQRHTAILAYSERPGVIGSVSRTRQLFGRVLPEHLEAQERAVRVDQLLD